MHYLSIAAIFENENSWIEEWIRYYMGIGVEHFYLYNHDTDSKVSDRILEPYVSLGIVENIHVADSSVLQSLGKALMQPAAMQDAFRRAVGKSHWLAVVDLDEFILPKQSDHLPDVLKEYEEYSGLVAHWQQFGTSGFIKRPATQINHLLHRAPSSHWTGRQFKSIMKPECVDIRNILQNTKRQFTPHIYPILTGKTVNELHREIQYDAILQPSTGEKIVVNHYILRSYQDYWEVKHPRGRFNGMHDFPDHYWEENDLNDVYDDEISKRFGHFIVNMKKNDTLKEQATE